MFQKILAALGGSLVRDVGEVVDRFVTTDQERNEAKLQMAGLVMRNIEQTQETFRAELDVQKSVMVAELQSGDSYTRRARPTIVYVGLGSIVANYVVGPWAAAFLGVDVPKVELPVEFWWTFGSVVSVWSVGRSAERRGAQDKLTKLITG